MKNKLVGNTEIIKHYCKIIKEKMLQTLKIKTTLCNYKNSAKQKNTAIIQSNAKKKNLLEKIK